jgi:hypothetical protein
VDRPLILDRYRPLEDLGQGGYGSVVLAWDTRMQRRVAIKRLPLPRGSRGTGDLRTTGLAEARTAAMLSHPAILTVHDFDTDADEAFLIMEYIEGASLREVLDELGGALNLDEAAAVLEPVFDAVIHAHENGVLHLDIKPENVLVSRDGTVKVTDFGVSALSSAVGHGAASAGTPGYAPPEQLRGEEVDQRSDEWSIGALAYELLTGRDPFPAGNAAQAIAAAESSTAREPSLSRRDLSETVDDALLAALDPDPARRPRSVAALADALLPELGDPAAGRELLAEVAERFVAEVEPDELGLAELGLWDRAGRAGSLATRAVAALVSGWLAFVGLAPLVPGTLAPLVAALLVGVAGALAPTLGAGLGLIAFTVGLFASGMPAAGALFALVASAYWWLFGRRNQAAAVIPLAAPLLAIARISPLAPILAGFSLPPLAAAATSGVSGLLAFSVAALSGTGAPYVRGEFGFLLDWSKLSWAQTNLSAALTEPQLWIVLVAWVLAGVVMSLLSSRASRVLAVLGVLAATGILWAGYTLCARISGDAGSLWTGFDTTVALGASLILGLLVCLLGPPMRAEEEPPFGGITPEEEL